MAAAKAKTTSKPPAKSSAKLPSAKAEAKSSGPVRKTSPQEPVKASKPAEVKTGKTAKSNASETKATKPKAASKKAAPAKSATKSPAAEDGAGKLSAPTLNAEPKRGSSGPTPTPPLSSVAPSTPQATRALVRGDLVLDKLHQVALTATNLDSSVEFYRDVLGLKFITRIDPPGLAYFSLGNGLRLLLSSMASQASLHFAVQDIAGAVNDLKKRGVSFMQPPALIHRDDAGNFGKKGVEEWMAFFRDPSGNMLALVERR